MRPSPSSHPPSRGHPSRGHPPSSSPTAASGLPHPRAPPSSSLTAVSAPRPPGRRIGHPEAEAEEEGQEEADRAPDLPGEGAAAAGRAQEEEEAFSRLPKLAQRKGMGIVTLLL